MKKYIKYFVYAFAIFFIANNVNAGVNFYANSTTVTIGNTIVVTVSAPDVAGNFSVTSSNTNVLSGGVSSEWIEGTVTFSFRANNVGSSTIRLVPIDAADYNGNEYSESHSITINVVPKQVVVLSDDNTLKNLGIENATISPEFNNDTLEYTAMLEAGTTKINILAEPNQGGSTITGNGEHEVVEGDNSFEIVVTAENGTSRTYKLNITVKEYNPVVVKIGKEDYTVVRNKNVLTPPENYKETTLKIGGEEVPAYKGKITKQTIVSLKDSKGNQNWYVVNKNNYSLYKEYKFGSTILYVIDYDKMPNGYKKYNIKYNKEKIEIYKNDKDSDYGLIYGMNVETGEKHLYMYENNEGTVQIYNENNNSISDLYLKILLCVSLGLVLSIGIIIYILVKKKNH